MVGEAIEIEESSHNEKSEVNCDTCPLIPGFMLTA
jgi:hypothetical protein